MQFSICGSQVSAKGDERIKVGTWSAAAQLVLIPELEYSNPAMRLRREILYLWLLFLLALPVCGQTPFGYSCGIDTQINALKRNAVNSAASKFVDTLLGSNPGAAFDLISKAGQNELTPEELGAQVEPFRHFEPEHVAVQHTYWIRLHGNPSPGPVLCAMDLSKPEGSVSLTVADIPEQAYAEFSAKTRNNEFAIIIWLISQQSQWKVQGFWINAATLGDKGPEQLLDWARLESTHSHDFNAALLLAAAAATANRGPNFRMGISNSIATEMSRMPAPHDLEGQPPFLWKSADTTFKVLNVGPIAIGGKVYVTLTHEVSPWQSDSQADGWNKSLITDFKQRFPEYSGVFAGVVARAMERGSNRGYGTVDETPSK
jgi:hypothetical protein